MNDKLSKVLKLIGDLSKQELMTLSQAVVSLIKNQQDVDFAKASVSFNKGDIVSYIDSSGIRVHGIITKKNPKTIQVTTENNYYVNIPATYLTLEEKPSAKLLDFRKKVAPRPKDVREILEFEFKKNTLH
jgi:ABC-type transporter Mla MlaB component